MIEVEHTPRGKIEIRNASVGALEGTQIQPRELAKFAYAHGWRDLNLVRMIAVTLAESQGYTHARNDNLDDAGGIISRDCGVNQINIPASKIGTEEETKLYDLDYNYQRARSLFESRGFQPWVAWNTGIAMRTDWWVWSKSKEKWVPTGRYVHRAVRGVANHFAKDHFDLAEPVPFTDYYVIPPKPTSPP